MDPLVIMWICATVAFVIIEAVTVQLVCIWFGVAALVTMFAALLGAPLWLQFTVFPVFTVLMLVFTRPIVKRLMTGSVQRTNADRILGKNAIVTQDINNDAAEGQVKVMGQIWSARTIGGEPLPAGASVIVRTIEGVKVLVEKT